MDKERIALIDELKGFAIFLVVLGHILQGKMFPLTVPLHTAIYSFHMPLFFLLSGFFTSNLNKSNKIYFFRRICRLLVPYLFFTILFYIVHYSDFYNVFRNNNDPYWFLLILVTFYFIVYSLGNCKSIHRFVGYVFFYMFVLSIPNDICGYLYIKKECVLLNFPFFVMGTFLYKRMDFIKKILSNFFIPMIAFLLIIIHYIFPHDESLFEREIIALSSIIIISCVFFCIEYFNLNIWCKYGRCTLSIYLFHYYFLWIVPNSINVIMGDSIFSFSSLQCIVLAIVCSVSIMKLCVYIDGLVKKTRIGSIVCGVK